MPSTNGKQCTVCELPDDIRDQVNRMMFLASSKKSDIKKHFRQVLHLQPPSDMMLDRHRDNQHHMPDGGYISKPEMAMAAKYGSGAGDVNVYDRVALNITRTMLPVLANIPERINVITERQEIYALTKGLVADQLESIENMPDIYTDADGNEYQKEYITKDLKDLIKMMGTQLNGIEESIKDIKNDDDLLGAAVLALMDVLQGDKEAMAKIQGRLFDATEIIDNKSDYEVSDEHGSERT